MQVSAFRYLVDPRRVVLGTAAAAVVLVGATFLATGAPSATLYEPVAQGPLTEEVDTTGTVKAAESVDLSFQSSGRIAHVYAPVGTQVGGGQILASLDVADFSAQVAQKKAALEEAEAKLAALEAGTRPEELSIDETSAAQAEEVLRDAMRNAFVAADDAVHARADLLFTNPRTLDARLSFNASDVGAQSEVQEEHLLIEGTLESWRERDSAPSGELASAAFSSESDLRQVGSFLGDLSSLIASAIAGTSSGDAGSIPTLTGYQTSVNAARLNVSSALSTLTTADTAYKKAAGTLALAKAGATPQDLDAADAGVAKAKADLDEAIARLSDARIVAPISGTVTVNDAHVGATASAGSPLISMTSSARFEIESYVSEADLGSIAVGESAQVSLDAYPEVPPFLARVVAVDPAATVRQAVASYKVTLRFDEDDERVRPGLTGNVRIVAKEVPDALYVPSSAIIRKDNGEYVIVKSSGGDRLSEVRTGVSSASGRTQILSGLSEGDLVRSFGSRTN